MKRMPRMVSVRPKTKSPTLKASMRLMPCGPLVMLTGAFRLLRKMRMISPNPSVTMAR
ncbi:Uncharacterised protein [Bordetella pertussis]|nr:Uncharacterised protein [Bordetella pertussis]CFU85359.1 Uncharacterised protein [Bordetella pertussis]CPL65166.1 Uncharacterised protein [Bordetella pertussis]CPM08184.1 Uncharacterised protein [Bordetella pertussis]CPN79968.1 Uncharacterised protein [Bordetella pertussis]